MTFGAEFKDYAEKIFSFPNDNVINDAVLKVGSGKGELRIGLDRWGNESLLGTLYPSNAKAKDFLILYGRHFNTIELNATHYKIFDEKGIQDWARKVPDDFLFCPKYLQSITHYSKFKNVEADTEKFMNGLLAFGEKLGPIFLQFSEKIHPSTNIQSILDYLECLRLQYPDQKFFIELRHPDWFAENVWQPFVQKLAALKVGLVITDTPNAREVLHMTLTVPEILIRFICLGNHPQDDIRILEWKEKISEWKSKGLDRAFIFLHIQDEQQIASYSNKVQQLFEIETTPQTRQSRLF